MKTREDLIKLGIKGFKADEIMLLQERMLEEAVKFQFVKKDGTIRDAVGTLKHDLMKQEDGTLWEPKGESKPEPASIIRFFDTEKGLWRCFTCTQFIGLVEG
jgi:hypothetical protein